MSDVAHTTIAQAIYADPRACNFPRVVSEFENLLSRLRNTALRTRWDYDDVVVFDIGPTRIVLGWSEDRTDDRPACLLVSVGPLPTAFDAPHDPTHELLCSRLIERIQTRYAPDAVLWLQLPLAIEPDLVDVLIDSLPSMGDIVGTNSQPEADIAPATSNVALHSTGLPANDVPDLPQPAQSELGRVRAALYPPTEAAAEETAQLRLAAQAMNATLIVVWMPLGVAAMTYTLMKGEKVGFSARMMAVSGTLIGLAQSPAGQQFAAFAGV